MTSLSERPDAAALAAFRQWLVGELVDASSYLKKSLVTADAGEIGYAEGLRAGHANALAAFDRRFPPQEVK